ncbi:MAG: GNAT family N-acetyltransferase [Bacillota bacterium]
MRADPVALIIVAKAGEELLGLGGVRLQETGILPAVVQCRYALLQGLMAVEGRLGQGEGRKLVYAAEEWARARGVMAWELKIWDLPWSVQLCRSPGYQMLKQKLSKKL